MINPRPTRAFSPDTSWRLPKAKRGYRFLIFGLSVLVLLLTTNVFWSGLDVAAQVVDPGETNPIRPSARRTLFSDQHALVAMPQNPTSQQPPSTYTDWARSSNLQSLELQEAFVPALQNVEQARTAAGRILNQMNEQVAVGRFIGPATEVENTIQVDLLTSKGDIELNATTTIPAVSTNALFQAPIPNSFDVAVGNLSPAIDEEGIGHDEVVVCSYVEKPLIGRTLFPQVTVIDYTNLTESGEVRVTTDNEEVVTGPLIEFNWDQLLLKTGSDRVIACDTADLNGDGVDEIIVASLIGINRALVSVLRYTNDGENPPTVDLVGSTLGLDPIRNQSIQQLTTDCCRFWGSVDIATGDFNADGREDVAVSIVNRLHVLVSGTLRIGTYPGIYVLESDTDFNLTQQSRFAEFEVALTGMGDFNNGGGSYACRPTPSKQACETTRASVVAGLFKFHPPTGFDFDRRQLAVVYNMPFVLDQGGGLRSLALEISDDLKTITPLGENIALPQQVCPDGVSLCPSSNRFSVDAGGLVGAGNLNNPQWSLVVSNWEATRDGNENGSAAGQFHGFWVQTKPVDSATGEGGGLDVVWDAVLLDEQEISGIQNARLPAVAWDREGVSLYLGSPVHIVVNDLLQTNYIIEEPPKHTYWWPPDATNVADGEVMNVSRDDTFFIELSDEESLDYAETSRNVTDWTIGGSVTASAKASVSVGKDVVLAKSKATASVEVVGKVGYDYNENKDEYEKDYREQTTTFTGTTQRDDLLIALVQLYDIWRYPVSGIPLDDDLNAFWEISFPGREVTVQGGGLSFDWFTPPYENGNILSYPRLTGTVYVPPDCCAEFTFLENNQEETKAIPFLDNRLLALDGTGATIQLKFSESSGEGSEKTYKHKLSESLDVTVGYKTEGKIFGASGTAEASLSANIHNSNSWSEIETSDSNTNNSTGFKLNKPARNPNQSYFFLPTFYLAADGTTKVAHAVNVQGTGSTFWTETYGTLPDPALKLPQRFSPIAVFMERTIWVPNESADAKKIRGFYTRYAEPDQAGAFPPVAGAATEGDRLRLEVEVHNYSVLQGFSGMPIQFEAVQLNGNSEGARIPITCEAGSILILALNPLEHKTAICVWDTKGFGPGIPGGIQNYRIYVTLDPDNQITELYEGTVGPGQNNQGWSPVSVADPLLTFLVPTPTAAVPRGADVRMNEDALAIQVDGQLETKFAHVVADQLTPLRVCVETDQTQTGYHHILIYDGNPRKGGQLLADKLISGTAKDGGTCVWLDEFRLEEPGLHKLFAQILETRDDGQVGNATDTLRVRVDPIPTMAPTFDQGVAHGVGSAKGDGMMKLSGTFPYDGNLDFSKTTLVMTSVLEETRGAGELIPGVQALTGQDLTLFARDRHGPIVRFETPEGQVPRVQVHIKPEAGTLHAHIHVEGANILEPARCGGNAFTKLTTRLFLLDNEHAPVDLTFKKKHWACKKNRRGDVTVLRLPPG